MTTSVFAHRRCRLCGGDLTDVLNLGSLYLNAFPQHLEEVTSGQKIPHILTVCRGCSLCQLAHTTPADWMFRQYWYKSGINEMMQVELREIAVQAVTILGRDLLEDDWILDIGANDGTLLRTYQTAFLRGNGDYSCRWNRVAVEPARNLQDELRGSAEVVINDYFPTKDLAARKRQFKIITAIAMCYDLEKPLDFFLAISELLHPSGVAIVQFQDLEQQMRCAAFDNIVAEHLEYYTLHSLCQALTAAGLYPVHCQHSRINGGSLRVTIKKGYVQQKDWPATVQQQLALEERQGLSISQVRQGLQAFDRFAWRVEEVKRLVKDSVEIGARHGTVSAYGASTKGNTLFQVLGLGPDQIACVADRSPEKPGRLTVTGIPIVSEEEWRALVTPLTLVPIWQFRPGVVVREREYLNKGGRFLFPLPYSEVVGRLRGV